MVKGHGERPSEAMIDWSVVPNPHKTSDFMHGLFGTVEAGIDLPDSAQALLQKFTLQPMWDSGAIYGAQYLNQGKLVWVQNNGFEIATAPKFNSDDAPPIRPSNFGDAKRVVCMTHISYRALGNPNTDLVFAQHDSGLLSVYYYHKGDLQVYANRGAFNSLERWDENTQVMDWFESDTRPRLGLWEKREKNSYVLLAEFKSSVPFNKLLMLS